MRARRSFRPSDLGPLEGRIALSHAAAVVTIPTTGLTATIRGTFTTVVPTAVGGAETSHLTGSAKVAHVGTIRLSGDLSSNASVTPNSSAFLGTLTFSEKGNVAVLNVFGPSGTDLAPRTRTTDHFTATVAALSGSSTGPFAGLVGATGTADLTLKAGAPRHGRSSGSFSLTLTEG